MPYHQAPQHIHFLLDKNTILAFWTFGILIAYAAVSCWINGSAATAWMRVPDQVQYPKHQRCGWRVSPHELIVHEYDVPRCPHCGGAV